MEPRWISKKALLLSHGESLAEFGGASGLRDESLLESALERRSTRLRIALTAQLQNWQLVMASALPRTTRSWMATSARPSFVLVCF